MQTVLITGAAQGIGFSTAYQLAKEGYQVYAMVRASSDSSALDQAISDCDGRLVKVVGDVTDQQSIDRVVDQIMQQSNRIDVVINNACHVVVGTCETCTIEEQQKSMDVNYFGVVRVLQAVLPHMRKQRSGRVINISSIAGYEPFPHLESYVASKFALEGMTESLVSHLAPWNIQVSLVEPVGVKTEAPRGAPVGSRVLQDTDAYREYCELAKQQMKDSYESSLEPKAIVDVVHEIIETKSPHLRYPVGFFAQTRAEARFCDPTGDSYVEYKKQLLKESGLMNFLG